MFSIVILLNHINLYCTYYMAGACSLTLLSGTDYSLCWRGINVWKFSQCEVSIFSSFLPPSLPLLRTAASEPTHDYWSLALEYDALPWRRACNRPNRCVSQLRVFMRNGGLLASKSVVPVCTDQKEPRKQSSLISSRPPMLWRKATGRCQSPHKVLPIHWVYLGRDVSANEILRLARYTEGVDCVGKWTHLAWGVGTDFKSLHLTKDMLDINLAGWHQHEMWDLIFVGSPP